MKKYITLSLYDMIFCFTYKGTATFIKTHTWKLFRVTFYPLKENIIWYIVFDCTDLSQMFCLQYFQTFLLLYFGMLNLILSIFRVCCPASWGCRIHRLLLCRGVRPPPNECPDMTLNNLMVRFQQCWSFGECGVPLHCHRSQVHSGPEW